MKRKHKHQHAGGEVTELARETAEVEQYWIVGDRPEPRKPPKNYNYVEDAVEDHIEPIRQEACEVFALVVDRRGAQLADQCGMRAARGAPTARGRPACRGRAAPDPTAPAAPCTRTRWPRC